MNTETKKNPNLCNVQTLTRIEPSYLCSLNPKVIQNNDMLSTENLLL